jgi:aspartyl-tRNA(Asn)/glutamyl-tRNA(Gln) amidotransferase subunit C
MRHFQKTFANICLIFDYTTTGINAMIVDDTLLTKLEKLSSLEIKEEQRHEIKSQIENIITFVDSLSELDDRLEGIEFPRVDKSLPLRADEPSKNDAIDMIIANAPKSEENFFVVPKIIE